MIRTVEKIVAPPPPHMVGDGFRVHNFFPSDQIDKKRMSPFFLLDYNAKIEFSPSGKPRGVGVHPHRGFETVTISYHGRIAHHDSYGNKGIINDGDVQWMTAGAGILHKEYHEENFSKTGGLFQMVQLWVNLPAAYKMTKPRYQEIDGKKINTVNVAGGKGTLSVIAGEYEQVTGAAETFTPMHIYNISLQKNAVLPLQLPGNFNTGILVVEGEVMVNTDQKANTDYFVLMNNDGTSFTVTATADAKILLLSGEPINEPIAQYGPFLMNTYQELEQAINDVSAGKFGILED